MSKQRKPTERMLQVLRFIADGLGADYGCYTRSDYGGRHGTLFALFSRGLIDSKHRITDAGRAMLRAQNTGRPTGPM